MFVIIFLIIFFLSIFIIFMIKSNSHNKTIKSNWSNHWIKVFVTLKNGKKGKMLIHDMNEIDSQAKKLDFGKVNIDFIIDRIEHIEIEMRD